jgi:transcription elongation factor Elf1
VGEAPALAAVRRMQDLRLHSIVASKTTLKPTERLRRVLPICSNCGESYKFEPLKHGSVAWHFRCLHCGAGVELLEYERQDRRRNDRRTASEQRRRLSDLQVAEPCRRCGHRDVRGWFVTDRVLWVKCERCSHVAPIDRVSGAPQEWTVA